MKRVIKKSGIALVILTLVIFTACNQKEKKEDKTQANLNELKSELKDVGNAIDNLADSESEEFKHEALAIIDDFNHKIANFENQLEQNGQEIDQKTQERINDLRQTSNKIEAKLNEIDDKSKSNWEEIKQELNHDFSQFGSSLKDFFNDNV